MQVKLTAISYIGTLFKVWFRQDFVLSKVWFRQVKLTNINYIGTLFKVWYMQDSVLSRVWFKHVKYKQFPTLRLYLEFGLYTISFYPGFGLYSISFYPGFCLHRFYCNQYHRWLIIFNKSWSTLMTHILTKN